MSAGGSPASSGDCQSSCTGAGLWAQVPTWGRRALVLSPWSLFLTVWSQTCTCVAPWRSCLRALTVFLLLLLTQRSRCQTCCWVDALLWSCSALSSYYSLSPVVSWYHTLWNWGTEKTLCRHIWECLCFWRSWSSCAASIGCRYHLRLPAVMKSKTTEKSVWRKKEKAIVCGHRLQNNQTRWNGFTVFPAWTVISLKVNKLCYTVKMVCSFSSKNSTVSSCEGFRPQMNVFLKSVCFSNRFIYAEMISSMSQSLLNTGKSLKQRKQLRCIWFVIF